MARRKKKVVLDNDESYMVDMQIKPDEKGFSLDVYSKEAMTSEEIILTIETWLFENILQGFDPESDRRH